MNDIIYNELCLGIVSDVSREKLLNIVIKLENSGARGIILGFTEIGLLIKQGETTVILFDTVLIHAKKAALVSIGG